MHEPISSADRATLTSFSRFARAGATPIRIAILTLALALLVLLEVNWDLWIGMRMTQTTDNAYLQSDLTPLSAKVSGFVRSVPIRDFQTVKAGDLLVEIDDREYNAAVAEAEANVAGASAAIQNNRNQRSLQEDTVRAGQAGVAASLADLERYRLEADRQRKLVASGNGTTQLLEQAEDNERRTAATVAQSQAQLDALKRQLDVLDSQKKQLDAVLSGDGAVLDVARLNLGYTRIVASFNGVVGQRQVRPSQYVAIGQQVISIVPLPNIWVIANYKETQMTKVRIGQQASIAVDAFPGMSLKGHVDSWSPASGSQFALLPPDNATGNFTKVVQRIPVKIVIDADAAAREFLRPGMSVIASIATNTGGAVARSSAELQR